MSDVKTLVQDLLLLKINFAHSVRIISSRNIFTCNLELDAFLNMAPVAHGYCNLTMTTTHLHLNFTLNLRPNIFLATYSVQNQY